MISYSFRLRMVYSSHTRFDGFLCDQLCGEPSVSSETKPIGISATLIFDVEVPSSCFGRSHMISSSTQDVSWRGLMHRSMSKFAVKLQHAPKLNQSPSIRVLWTLILDKPSTWLFQITHSSSSTQISSWNGLMHFCLWATLQLSFKRFRNWTKLHQPVFSESYVWTWQYLLAKFLFLANHT